MADYGANELGDQLNHLEALQLALSGDADGAEALLRQKDENAMDARALDLLARIAITRGQTPEAERLWKAALVQNPEFVPAREALACLASHWRFKAVLRRLAVLAGYGLVLCLSVLGLVSVTNDVLQPRHGVSVATAQSGGTETEGPVGVKPDAVEALTDNAGRKKTAAASGVPEAPFGQVWPEIAAPGFRVEKGADYLELTPMQGLFRYRCEFAEQSQFMIDTVGKLAMGSLGNCTLVIVGHADSDPPSENSQFRSNYELGFSRASKVAEVLQAKYAVGSPRLSVISFGSENMPFPEDTPEDKMRNRTASFRFIRAQTPSSKQ